ncbi:MAG: MerR family DNA-binding transcriptional regulator [Granulosicoccaceae bacterium]
MRQSDKDIHYSIAELAKEFDITTRTIRFYEDKQLLKPARRGQQRVYSRADRTRLKLVLRGKRLGWPLDDIREMIHMYDAPGGEEKQLRVMINRINTSRETLLRQQEDIALALSEFDDIQLRCETQLSSLQISNLTGT